MPPIIQHPENFISVVTRETAKSVDVMVGPNASATTTTFVREAILKAIAAFRARRYSAAIEQYKAVQAEALRLLYPQHKTGPFVTHHDLMHPVGVQIERGLAAAGLRLIEGLQPDISSPRPPVNVDAGPIPQEVGRFGKLGFALGAAAAGDQINEGASLLVRGRAAEAASVLREAVGRLQAASNPDPALEGAALLNLSAAQLAQGAPQEAAETATRARRAFATAGDGVGEAQALHAAAIGQQRLGDVNWAAELFGKAEEIFRHSMPRRSSEPTDTVELSPSSERGLERESLRTTRLRLTRNETLTAGSALMRTSVAPIALSREVFAEAAPTTDVAKLAFIADRDGTQVSIRWPGAEHTWSAVKVANLGAPLAQKNAWKVGLPVGAEIVEVDWQPTQPPAPEALLGAIYDKRRAAVAISELDWGLDDETTTAAYLAHIYAYVVPVGLGDCYHELGNYARAEAYYLQAVDYSYLNPTLEAPTVWVRLAQNVVAWGDAYFRNEQFDEAKAIYAKLVRADGTPDPASVLYSHAGFARPAQTAREVLLNPGAIPANANPAIAHPLLMALARWQLLIAGLDFFGLMFTSFFTFNYLQDVARAFAQQAIQAEREYINFTVQAEAEAATRRDLESSLSMASIEARAQAELAAGAAQDVAAASAAQRLSQLRAQNARDDRDAYRDAGYWQYVSQSIATAHGAHADWHGDEIRSLARDIEQGAWEGDYGKLAAAATLLGGQKSYEYQLERMQNQIQELDSTIPIATAQRAAAERRSQAAQLQAQAASMRRNMVADALNAFENEVFTPEVWSRLSLVMREIAQSYQYWAIGAAKLMERAYNFETDSELAVIRGQYSVPETGDLLGSDLLLRDVESFTYHYIASVEKKESQIKDVISLRNEYPFQFYDFLRTGKMAFETSLYDFDRRHPGFYGQRLAAVELQLVGLLPPDGVRGTLSGGVASHYRKGDGGDRSRVHAEDTLAISEFTLRGDAYVFRADVRKLGLFEGHGVATSWRLELPRGVNNLDYRLLSDVQLVLYYTARYSSDLCEAVLARALLPGEDVHVRDFALRYDFPEVWWSCLKSNEARWTLDEAYLPRNETNFKSQAVAISLVTADGAAAAGVKVTLTLPGKAQVSLVTDATGAVAMAPGNVLAAAMGGDVIGEWSLKLEPPAGSPLLKGDGSLDPGALQNVAIILEYKFAYRG